jgi:hypothetical protein
MLKQEDVLKLLKEGKTTGEIAKLLKTRVGNVRAHVRRIRKARLWVPKSAGFQWPMDLDQVTDFLIERLEAAKRATTLEEQLHLCLNQKAALENEIKILREDISNKEDRKRRYKLAVQQGELPPDTSADRA